MLIRAKNEDGASSPQFFAIAGVTRRIFYENFIEISGNNRLSVVAVLAGCDQKQESAGPKYVTATHDIDRHIYRFALHPLHNPAKLSHDYQPLLDYLNKHIPDVQLILEASRNYQDFEGKYRQGQLDFLLPNPWQTLDAIKAGSYEVIAMAGKSEDFKGVFIVRKDSGIKKTADLKGKIVSYPSHTALAACIMPQYFLYTNGININTDIENRYVGSQESSIMNAYLKQSAVAATWPPPWRSFQKEHPEQAKDLMVIWETPSLINNSVMANKTVPETVRLRVENLLLALAATTEGRGIIAGMETTGFYEANNESYDVAKKYVERFEKKVRKVEQK